MSGTIELFRDFQAGSEDEANAALRYLNPALASTSRLFAELNRNTRDFERFIDEPAKLVTDVSLATTTPWPGWCQNLATTTDALADGRGEPGPGCRPAARLHAPARTRRS